MLRHIDHLTFFSATNIHLLPAKNICTKIYSYSEKLKLIWARPLYPLRTYVRCPSSVHQLQSSTTQYDKQTNKPNYKISLIASQ